MTNEQLIQTAKEAMRNDTVINKGIVELLCNAMVAVTEQRDAVVVEATGIQTRMQQLVDIINKADNTYCMCGDAMKSHGHGGCGSPTGMFDYHYGRWSESAIETPATSSAVAALRAEGINYAASRLAAAYNHGFVDKPLAEVGDVVRMILTAKEDMSNDPALPADGLSGEYAEKALEDWSRQLRESKREVQS